MQEQSKIIQRTSQQTPATSVNPRIEFNKMTKNTFQNQLTATYINTQNFSQSNTHQFSNQLLNRNTVDQKVGVILPYLTERNQQQIKQQIKSKSCIKTDTQILEQKEDLKHTVEHIIGNVNNANKMQLSSASDSMKNSYISRGYQSNVPVKYIQDQKIKANYQMQEKSSVDMKRQQQHHLQSVLQNYKKGTQTTQIYSNKNAKGIVQKQRQSYISGSKAGSSIQDSQFDSIDKVQENKSLSSNQQNTDLYNLKIPLIKENRASTNINLEQFNYNQIYAISQCQSPIVDLGGKFEQRTFKNNYNSNQMRTSNKSCYDLTEELSKIQPQINMQNQYNALSTRRKTNGGQTDVQKEFIYVGQEIVSPDKYENRSNRKSVQNSLKKSQQTETKLMNKFELRTSQSKNRNQMQSSMKIVLSNNDISQNHTQDSSGINQSILNQQASPLEVKPQTLKVQKMFQISDFMIKKELGKGSFGTVKLAYCNLDSKYYAIKSINKESIRDQKQIQHLINERNILRLLKSNQDQNLLKFYESLQDEEHLYLIMEYLSGGELFTLMKKQLTMDEESSKFYLAEILTGVEQLHGMNILYRDMKPENILIDAFGHVKLIDFGFSKQLKNIHKDRAYTNCGTPGYVAPEVLTGQGYSYKADIWSIGILICEMLGGFTPFNAKEDYGSHSQILEKMRTNQLHMPKNMNNVTRDLIKSILVFDANQRLELSDIKSHKFFRGIDWQKVQQRSYTPHYIPSDNFDDFPVTEQVSQSLALNNEKQVKEFLDNSHQNLEVPSSNSQLNFKQKSRGFYSSNGASPNKNLVTNSKVLGDYHMHKINKVFEDF
eukprot:403370015